VDAVSKAKVYARQIEMLAQIQAGYIPRELADDAMLMCEERPPAWRPFKRRRWEEAVKRVYKLLRFL
jgi:hypothetical protein